MDKKNLIIKLFKSLRGEKEGNIIRGKITQKTGKTLRSHNGMDLTVFIPT
jgi:hypothetical protein